MTMGTITTTSTRPTGAQPPTPIADRVIALVQAQPAGIGRSDIARALGVPPATVGSALSRAVTEGTVRRIGRGIYGPGAAAASSQQSATSGPETTAQERAVVQVRLGRMGRETGLLITAADGYGEAFVPREALPDLRRRLARAQAKIEARP